MAISLVEWDLKQS